MNFIDEDDLIEIEDIDQLKNYIENLNQDNNITNEDIIYFSNAIEYLKENDQSLQESLELASEFGYTTDNINSELLASLLKSKYNQDDFRQLIDDIIDEAKGLFNDE